jgi:hypothetical protein
MIFFKVWSREGDRGGEGEEGEEDKEEKEEGEEELKNRSWKDKKMGNYCLMGTGLLFGEMKKF